MKKGLKIFMFSVFCVCVSPLIVHAECSYERQAELNKIAGNVKFSYSYDINENNLPVFYANVSNITGDIYIVDDFGHNIDYASVSNIKYPCGDSIRFDIYSNDPNCHGEKITSKYLTIPPYNYYSRLPECSRRPEFKYCNMWFFVDIDRDEFYEKFKQYEDNIETNQKKDNQLKYTEINSMYVYIAIGLFLSIFVVYAFRRWKHARQKN